MKRRDKGRKTDHRLAMSPMFIVGTVATGMMLLLLGGGDIRRAFVARLNPRISVEQGAEGSEREGKRANTVACRKHSATINTSSTISCR